MNAKVLFPKIPIKYLKQIPIRFSDGKISRLAGKIQSLKKNGANTTDLEQEIDNLVYGIYNLEYDEVLAIQPDFTEQLSKVDYEKYRKTKLRLMEQSSN